MWPFELGLGIRNPRFVGWPLELGLGTRNPRFVAWPVELGFGTLKYLIMQRMTVAVDMSGNIIWICPLAPGTSSDVLIWDGCGPSRTRGHFFDFGALMVFIKARFMSLHQSLEERMAI